MARRRTRPVRRRRNPRRARPSQARENRARENTIALAQVLPWVLGAGAVGAVILLASSGTAEAAAAIPGLIRESGGLEPYAGSPSDGASGHRTPSPPRYVAKRLPGNWSSAQRCDFVRYMRILLMRNGMSRQTADLFIAHVARETGWGRNVFNYNFGNIKQAGSFAWHRLNDHEPYKTYESADAGIQDNINLVRNSSRYADAWRALSAGDQLWYSRLGLAGYYEYQPPADPVTGVRPPPRRHTVDTVHGAQLEYEGVLRRVRECA